MAEYALLNEEQTGLKPAGASQIAADPAALPLPSAVADVIGTGHKAARLELEGAIDDGLDCGSDLHPMVLFDLQPKGLKSVADHKKTPPARRSIEASRSEGRESTAQSRA